MSLRSHVSALAVVRPAAAAGGGGAGGSAGAALFLLSGGVDGSVRLWALPSSEPLCSLTLSPPSSVGGRGEGGTRTTAPPFAGQHESKRSKAKLGHANPIVSDDFSAAVDTIAFCEASGQAAVAIAGCAPPSPPRAPALASAAGDPRTIEGTDGGVDLTSTGLEGRSTALAVLLVRAEPEGSASLELKQWVQLGAPPSPGALAFGEAEAGGLGTLLVGSAAGLGLYRREAGLCGAVVVDT